MKKILFLMLSVALLAACGGNKYSVSGTIEGAADGDTVLICDISNGVSLQAIDSTVVKNGKFSFKGQTDTCDVCILAFNIDGQMNTCTFFLEPGNIKINYSADQTQTVGGTISNDAFQKFYDEIDKVEQKAMDLDKRMQQATAAGENMESYQDEMDDVQDMYRDVVQKSIRENVDNMFGFNQLLDYYSMFEPTELEELLKAMEPKFSGNQYIVQLKEMVASQLKTAIGQPYQNFSAPDVDGNEHSLAEYVGQNKLVLLDFWASWCEPCRGEIPSMKSAYEKFHSMGFEIVSVSVDDNEEAWKEALEAENMPWPQLYDPNSGEGAPAFLYAITMIPSSFLIDSDGEIIGHNLRGEEYEKVLSDYFK